MPGYDNKKGACLTCTNISKEEGDVNLDGDKAGEILSKRMDKLFTAKTVKLRTVGRALGDTVGEALACSGQAVSQKGLWLVRCLVGARVDTKALRVLRP